LAWTVSWEDWREPLHGDPQGRRLGNYRLTVLAMLLIFVALYLVFR
jgi:hypothetical protein